MKKKVQTRKEREREFKKSEILDAAIHIFAKKGFKATTLDEIAEKSEFGKGTIYNYFSNKEEIYREIIIYISALHKKSMFEIVNNTETFYDFIFEMIKSHMTFCIKNKDAYFLLVYTKIHHAKSTSSEISKLMDCNHNEITEFFIERIKMAIVNSEVIDMDPEKIIRIIRGITFTYVYESLLSDELKEEHIETDAKFIADILFDGIKLK